MRATLSILAMLTLTIPHHDLMAADQDVPPEEAAQSSDESGKEEYPTKSLYFQYNTGFAHSDHGLEKTPGQPDPSATTLSENMMYLGFNGMMDAKTQFAAYLSLTAETVTDAVEVANATRVITDNISLSIGINYLTQGGFDNQNWIFETLAVSP